MKRSAKSASEEEVGEANVLPVMNIMFLLIPALLLAMEVASMAAIMVSPPHFSPMSKTSDPPPQQVPLKFKVEVRSDGYRATVDESAIVDPEAGTIPRKDGELNHAQLTAFARDLKANYRNESVVTVTAEYDVDYGELVATMDALRGPDCKVMKPDESECLFWQPIVEAR